MSVYDHYDNSLADEYAHPHVRRARAAGRAWAEREADAARTVEGDWLSSAHDALALVSFHPSSMVEDQDEREEELCVICNNAAAERWRELVAWEGGDVCAGAPGGTGKGPY